jgi:acetylornithine deacetylase/succinyl-diaminopimelate desuccinylase-like protein
MMLQSAWFDRAHKADEYIERSELASCDAFLDGLIADIAR